jgi:uncharacterized lipoprotein
MAEKTEQKKSAPRVEVTLKKDHRHAGKDRQPGDKIMVTDWQRKRLKEREII